MEEIETWVLLYIFCNLESAKYCVLVYKDKGIGCLHISTHLDLIKKTKPELKCSHSFFKHICAIL